MEEFRLILKGIIVFIAYGVAVFAISYADTIGRQRAHPGRYSAVLEEVR